MDDISGQFAYDDQRRTGCNDALFIVFRFSTIADYNANDDLKKNRFSTKISSIPSNVRTKL